MRPDDLPISVGIIMDEADLLGAVADPPDGIIHRLYQERATGADAGELRSIPIRQTVKAEIG